MKCTIDLSPEGGFLLGIPSSTTEAYHHVDIPPTEEGCKILLRILRDRAKAAKSTIGTNGSPIRQQVEAWLRAEREERAKKPILISGIDIGDLDL